MPYPLCQFLRSNLYRNYIYSLIYTSFLLKHQKNTLYLLTQTSRRPKHKMRIMHHFIDKYFLKSFQGYIQIILDKSLGIGSVKGSPLPECKPIQYLSSLFICYLFFRFLLHFQLHHPLFSIKLIAKYLIKQNLGISIIFKFILRFIYSVLFKIFYITLMCRAFIYA